MSVRSCCGPTRVRRASHHWANAGHTVALGFKEEATNTGWLPRWCNLGNYHSNTATKGQLKKLPQLKVPSTRVECTVHRLPGEVTAAAGSQCGCRFFFHEYGRRVGMVPRSSLKEGKVSRMVEKITRTTTKTQKPQTKAHRPSLHHHVVFPLC